MSTGNEAAVMAALSRQAEASLRALGLRSCFTLDDLHQRLEARRGRPIHLIPRELPALAPHGLWISATSADYVFYGTNGGPTRAHQIIGHEYGHILYDDTATSTELADLVKMLMPTVDPAAASNLLGRTTYEPLRERRAEVFGSVVLGRAEGWTTIPGLPVTDPDVLSRMITTLEGGREA